MIRKSTLLRRFSARLVFIIGLSFMILGVTFLFGSNEGTSSLFIFIAFLLVITGTFCAFLALRLNRRTSYLFFASFFFMTGIYLFLSALDIIPLSFTQAWPLLSVFSGLALLPVGWKRTGGFNLRYFVSSLAFVILGFILLIFSLGMAPFSFRQFISEWWPQLLVFCGVTLVLISLTTRFNTNPGNRNYDKSREQPE